MIKKPSSLVTQPEQLIGKLFAAQTLPIIGKALNSTFVYQSNSILSRLSSNTAQHNFRKYMHRYAENLKKIPPEKLSDVSPQLGVPIIEHLTYTTNQEIAQMYINLLSTASSKNSVNNAHPVFISIIERMSVDEARLIAHLGNIHFIPFITIYYVDANDEFHRGLAYATALENKVKLIFPGNISFYISNLINLGIIESQGNMTKSDERVYNRIIKAYDDEIEIYKMSFEFDFKIKRVQINKGYFEITTLGRQFIEACTSKTSEQG